MSQKHAEDFLKKYKADVAFRHELEKAKNDTERQQIVKNNGFNFTKDELKTASSSVQMGAPVAKGSANWTSAAGTSASAASAAAAGI
jgi:predicted ribosomally synthesized peptide with nif11-like leader